MNNLLDDTRFIMDKYHIRANKSLGQNFLIDENVVNNIVNGSNISKDDLVIEIGPGLGTLTRYLLDKAGKVVSIELDKKMLTILNDRFKLYDNFELIHSDVLKTNLVELIKEQKEKLNLKHAKVVANLPYYITTPIIMKLLEEKLDLESITVMVQKEVADRLIAIPGNKDAGAITYSVYYYATSESILDVPNTSFIPAPEVNSKVIKLNIRKEPPIKVKSPKIMFKIIKCAFMQRRKTLLNSLTNAKVFLNKEEGIHILNKLNLADNIRAEKLTIQDFANITNEILKE